MILRLLPKPLIYICLANYFRCTKSVTYRAKLLLYGTPREISYSLPCFLLATKSKPRTTTAAMAAKITAKSS